MNRWRDFAERALVDLTSALNDTETNAAGHLRDAQSNLLQAVEALEDEDGD